MSEKPTRMIFMTTSTPSAIPPLHPIDSLPEDPDDPGARLVPAEGDIEIEPGLIATADPKVYRSVRRLPGGELRWTGRLRLEEWQWPASLPAPFLCDMRKMTIGISVVPRSVVEETDAAVDVATGFGLARRGSA